MAGALKTLNLFKGSYTGYGQGYDLEVAPTRLQALIMFIRVLGEEEQALAWTGSQPFTDIAPGTQSEKYVGYAYEKGYTNGYSATTFRPSQAISANQYVEFMLRALGYSSADNKVVSDALERALSCSLLTPARYPCCKAPRSYGPIWSTSPITLWTPSSPAIPELCGIPCCSGASSPPPSPRLPPTWSPARENKCHVFDPVAILWTEADSGLRLLGGFLYVQ